MFPITVQYIDHMDTVQGKSFILLIGSTVGVIVRLLICVLFINTSFALFVFGIVNFIDFYFRSIVYRVVLYKLYKKENLHIKKMDSLNM